MTHDSVEAYPLHWPPGRKRCNTRKRANFHRRVEERSTTSDYVWQRKQSLTIDDSRDRLFRELESLGAKRTIISSNLELKNDGTPRSSQREPDDPGIAVYFQLNNQPHSLSCDTWGRSADNLAAIAKHVEAMRGQLRWGVADVASMFAGFKALPGAIVTPVPMSVDEASAYIKRKSETINGKNLADDPELFKDAYRAAAMKLHPDTGIGGEDWHQLQRAAEVLREHHAGAQ